MGLKTSALQRYWVAVAYEVPHRSAAARARPTPTSAEPFHLSRHHGLSRLSKRYERHWLSAVRTDRVIWPRSSEDLAAHLVDTLIPGSEQAIDLLF